MGKLCEEAGRFKRDFLEQKKRWALLDSYYVPTRYPNRLPEDIPARLYNEEAAQGAVALASKVVEYVERALLGREKDDGLS